MMNMKQADLVTSIILILLGGAMVWGGFTMDRLEVRGIHPASIPGLVPMGVGGALALCGILLFASNVSLNENVSINLGDTHKLVWAVGLCSIFALLLVGRLPFFVAVFIFVSVTTLRFSWRKGEGAKGNRRQIIFALLSGLIFSTLITLLFRYAFLVRLP